VHATLAAVALGEAEGRLEASNAGPETAAGRASATLVGAERTIAVAGRGAPAESLTVRVPDWASRAVVDVTMPREQWNEFTDFGVTDFDSTGQQVGQGALNYAFGRHAVAVPATLRGHAFTVELFPAFARENGVQPWRASVRIRFLLAQPRPLGGGANVSVATGGRTAVPLPAAPSPSDLALPEGFGPLIELRVRSLAGTGPDAVRRVVLQR
jgi:hypothetical protein